MNEDRRGYLGGSDVASIFGVSPWKSAFDLWEEKTAPEFIPPQVEPEREKLYRRGKKLEPWVMELLEEERGITIMRRNQRYVDPEFEWMACEVDFEYMDNEGLCNGEVKTVSPFATSEWGAEGTDDFPIYYCLQSLWGLMITGRPKTMMAPLIGADDLRVYEVKRDEELIAEMRRRAIEFWNVNVIGRKAPDPQTQSDTLKILSKYGGFESQGSPEVWKAVKRLKGIRAAQKRLETAKDQQEMTIKKALVVEAEAMGVTDSPKKFIIHDESGKKLATLAMQHRSSYTVRETDFLVLRT